MDSYIQNQQNKIKTDTNKDIVIVYLHGMLGWGKSSQLVETLLGNYFNTGTSDYVKPSNWANWDDIKKPNIREHYLNLDKLSNFRDNAINAFFSIRGGVADYGVKYDEIEKKAKAMGIKNYHKRFGSENYAGVYNEWSNKNPIFIICHSFGAMVAYELQRLLYTGYFHQCTHYKNDPAKIDNKYFNQNSIAMICTVHGCMGGTLMPHYLFGVFDKDSAFNEKEKLMPEKEKLMPEEEKLIPEKGKNEYFPFKLSPFNLGFYLAIFFGITQTLSTTNRLFDWFFSYKLNNYTWDISLYDILTLQFLDHPWYTDNCIIDLSMRGTSDIVKNYTLHKETIYLSISGKAVTDSTLSIMGHKIYLPTIGFTFFIWWVFSLVYSNFIFLINNRAWPNNDNWIYKELYLENDFIENDALVPLYSQICPSYYDINCKKWKSIAKKIYYMDPSSKVDITKDSQNLYIFHDKYNPLNNPYNIEDYYNLFQKGNLYAWIPSERYQQLDHLSVVLSVNWFINTRIIEAWKILFKFIVKYAIINGHIKHSWNNALI